MDKGEKPNKADLAKQLVRHHHYSSPSYTKIEFGVRGLGVEQAQAIGDELLLTLRNALREINGEEID